MLELCPGGHGKSQTAYDWVTWKVVQNRFGEVCGAAIGELNVAFLSVSADLGLKWLRQIKQYLESDKITTDFGTFRNSAKWSDQAIIVLSPNNPNAKVDHPTVTSVGIGGQIFGPRVHILVWDDIADKDNSGTEEARKKLWAGFHEGPYCWRRPGGKRWGIGTRMHSKDIYSKKIKQAKNLVRDDGLTKVYKGKNIVVRVDRAVNFDTGKVLAPENKEYTVKFFKAELDGMFSASFNRRYQNVAIDEADAAFKEEWFPPLYDENRPYGYRDPSWHVYIGVDPAVGMGKGRSSVGIAAVGYDPKEPHKRYLIDYVSDQLTPEKQADVIMGWYIRLSASMIRIEKNACQLYLKSYVMERAKALGTTPNIQMTFTGAQKWDLEYGVNVLSAQFENGSFRLPYSEAAVEKTGALRDILVGSDPAKPPDIVMAIWFVEQHLIELSKNLESYYRKNVPQYLAGEEIWIDLEETISAN